MYFHLLILWVPWIVVLYFFFFHVWQLKTLNLCIQVHATKSHIFIYIRYTFRCFYSLRRGRCGSGLWDKYACLQSGSVSYRLHWHLMIIITWVTLGAHTHTRTRTHTQTGSLTTHCLVKNIKTLVVTWCWVSIDLLSGGFACERTSDSTLSQHLTIYVSQRKCVCVCVRTCMCLCVYNVF